MQQAHAAGFLPCESRAIHLRAFSVLFRTSWRLKRRARNGLQSDTEGRPAPRRRSWRAMISILESVRFGPLVLLAAALLTGLPQSLAPYASTPEDVVDRMLVLAGTTREDVVYDLGCGDGRIPIAAAENLRRAGRRRGHRSPAESRKPEPTPRQPGSGTWSSSASRTRSGRRLPRDRRHALHARVRQRQAEAGPRRGSCGPARESCRTRSAWARRGRRTDRPLRQRARRRGDAVSVAG